MAHSTLLVVCLAAAVGVSGVSCKLTNDQIDALRKLGCEPRPVVVDIKKELGSADDRADREFYPHVVVVKRCLMQCSFCGTPELGVPEEECLPTGSRKYTVDLSFAGIQKRESIEVEEHTACDCYRKQLPH